MNASPGSHAKKPVKRLRPGGGNSPGRKNNISRNNNNTSINNNNINRNSSNRNNNGRNMNNGGCTCKSPAAQESRLTSLHM